MPGQMYKCTSIKNQEIVGGIKEVHPDYIACGYFKVK
jgi:hypothetical protein